MEARITHPIGKPTAWRLSGLVKGKTDDLDVKVSGARLPASAPTVLDPVELRPYLVEWARSRGWELHDPVELDLKTFPGRLRFYCSR